ncbi:aldehyde dehydrogenase family protein, partial [Polymorphobacter multimanifer]|uniref:aldehyde dehydrogenase family protein n=1 Tax=Polymorphobacter multimanifer TaxID=1070431 RepID=UPI001FB0D0DB
MVTIDVKNPRTGLVDHRLPGLDSAGVMAVAARLRVAQPGWAARPLATRLAALGRLADALDSHADAIVAALEADTGRRHISRVEVMGVKGMIARWQRDAGPLIAGVEETLTPTALPGVMAATRLHPYPLVGIISPWNFPLTLAMIDAVPALAAGCAVMIKPSEIAPRFIAPLRAAIADVPELADVLALIEGDGGTGAALVGAVDYVAFTGSVATGRRVAAAAAAAVIPASLELGGKDPMIVLASAAPDWAAGVALRASVLATGQACQSIERVYVDRAIAGPFLEALVAAAEAVTLNWPDVG